MGLQRQDSDHGLVVVTHVGTLRGTRTSGTPPEPAQADDMINAQATGMPQDRGDHVANGLVPGGDEPIRPPRWLVPILALLIEGIRRAANRDAFPIIALQAPRIRAAGAH